MFARVLRRQQFPHFYHYPPSPLLIRALQGLGDTNATVVDLGCGDGAKICALQRQGLLPDAEHVIGVDLERSRLTKFKGHVRGAKALVADAMRVGLNDGCADLVICSMLLEHVVDDQALVGEIRRLLRPRGFAFVSTVVKRWYGIWLYRRDGRFTLAPEHVREYPSVDAVLSLLRQGGLTAVSHREVGLCRLSPAEAGVFLLANFGLMRPEVAPGFFLRSRWHERAANVRIPFLGPVGFRALHVLAQRCERRPIIDEGGRTARIGAEGAKGSSV